MKLFLSRLKNCSLLSHAEFLLVVLFRRVLFFLFFESSFLAKITCGSFFSPESFVCLLFPQNERRNGVDRHTTRNTLVVSRQLLWEKNSLSFDSFGGESSTKYILLLLLSLKTHASLKES